MNAVDDGDDWAVAATEHDSLVIDMLLQLKHHPTRRQVSASRPSGKKRLVPELGWGVKHPRSASAATGVVFGSRSKERIGRGRRCSPSTPLSWSGGSGVEGCEASSLLTNRSPISRSKINLDGNGVYGASSSKLRMEKTRTELVEEEEILLKESMHLKQELVMLGATVKEQRVENENLKRIKRPKLTKNYMSTAADASGSRDAASRQAVMKADAYDCATSTSIQGGPIPSFKLCKAECGMSQAQKRTNFVVPDLNMMPSELDSTR